MNGMLSIIVPCYNEEASLPLFFKETEKVKPAVDMPFEYIFVNDGSSDQTLNVLRRLYKDNPESVRYLSFSRNFGKEAALYAGLQAAKGDFVTVMDADLQDPPTLLPEMFARLANNPELDCVGTRRADRKGEPKIRSFFSNKFYNVINTIADTYLVNGARDFRLMRRNMVDAVLQLSEYNRFSKGIFSWVGFETEYIAYDNIERVAGETSWSFWKLFQYSIDGIVNFSDTPLNIASFIGAFSCIGSIVAMIFIVIRTFILGDPTSGWPSMVSIFLFVGGLQLLCLGIIGKYIGKIFLETKNRPLYFLKETEQDQAKRK
ncbi:MAG TPA: glycosyltransferase [Enterococcus sp.]|nr:glycosyltransferase [Enterococcus sp.]